MTRPMAEHRSGLPCEDNAAHLRDELRKLDMLIERRALALGRPRRLTEGLAASKGVFISHEEFDALLRHAEPDEAAVAAASDGQDRLTSFEDAIAASVNAALERGVFLGLPSLVTRFELSPLERQAVVVCLAPELDRKYDTLYAYLQEDITRKKPSADLVLDLACMSERERWQARPVLSDQGALFRTEILETMDDPRSPSGSSGLARFIKLNDRILRFLLGNHDLDARLDGIAKLMHPTRSLDEVLIDPSIKAEAEAILAHHFSGNAFERDRSLSGCAAPVASENAIWRWRYAISWAARFSMSTWPCSRRARRTAHRCCGWPSAKACFSKAPCIWIIWTTCPKRTRRCQPGSRPWLI